MLDVENENRKNSEPIGSLIVSKLKDKISGTTLIEPEKTPFNSNDQLIPEDEGNES